jgi:hypothetical protein
LAIGFGKSREDDVVSLIAAKKYARAIEVLKAQLQKKGANPSLRMQLADVLILADKKQEAISLLIPLADQYAQDGFAAKAVSVLKKIQKVDPGRRDVEARLARQIEERQREATALPLSRPGGSGSEGAGGGFGEGPGLEIGFEMAPISAPVPAPPPLDLPKAVADAPPDATLPVGEGPPPAAPPMRAPLPPVAPPAPSPTPPAGMPAPAVKPAEEEIEDYDLLYYAEEGEEEEEEIDVPLEAELVEIEGAAPAESMSAGQFADELMGLVDSVFQEFPAAQAPVAPAVTDEPRGSQIVVSPLFRNFSVDEMVAVIQGLKLLSFERGDAIIREGQPGGSLYMLTSGRVRAFKKDVASGKQNPLGDLKEGAFFGEMSILTGQPRMASVVALARCELLELDRPALDGITKSHPHVWDVLREFAEKRAAQAR